MGERGGAETHATLITVVESPVVAGLIWAGTDDGNVQVTRDGGKTWTNVRPNIPRTCRARGHVGQPRRAVALRAGHRVRVVRRPSERQLQAVHPEDHRLRQDVDERSRRTCPRTSPVYVVKEDLKNPNLLFAGTEIGVYASIDGGAELAAG